MIRLRLRLVPREAGGRSTPTAPGHIGALAIDGWNELHSAEISDGLRFDDWTFVYARPVQTEFWNNVAPGAKVKMLEGPHCVAVGMVV